MEMEHNKKQVKRINDTMNWKISYIISAFLVVIAGNVQGQGLNLPAIAKMPTEIVEDWLVALDKNDFNTAYDLTKNISRIAFYDRQQFNLGYGCINRVEINSISETSRGNYSATVNASYNAFDPCNSDLELKQVFTLKKGSSGKWTIVEVENIKVIQK